MNETPFDSFVDPEDSQRLLDIIRKIKTNTLKDECSVLVLYGGSDSGKTTLQIIIEEVAPYPLSCKLPREVYEKEISIPPILTDKEVLIIVRGEMVKDDTNLVENIHVWTRNNVGAKKVFVVFTNKEPKITGTDIITLKLPHRFYRRHWTQQQSVVNACVGYSNVHL